MGKACGPDGIPPEVFRLWDFDDLLLEFCNDTLLKRDKPEQWSTLYLIPVPKSGDLSLTENYRGIALTCVIMKLYDWFNLFVGVLQGDTLAPYLFIIVLDYVMRQATEGKEEELGLTLKKRQSRRIGAQSVTDLDFADDLALL